MELDFWHGNQWGVQNDESAEKSAVVDWKGQKMTHLTSLRGDSEDISGLNIQQCWTFWWDTPHAVPPGSETSGKRGD